MSFCVIKIYIFCFVFLLKRIRYMSIFKVLGSVSDGEVCPDGVIEKNNV